MIFMVLSIDWTFCVLYLKSIITLQTPKKWDGKLRLESPDKASKKWQNVSESPWSSCQSLNPGPFDKCIRSFLTRCDKNTTTGSQCILFVLLLHWSCNLVGWCWSEWLQVISSRFWFSFFQLYGTCSWPQSRVVTTAERCQTPDELA